MESIAEKSKLNHAVLFPFVFGLIFHFWGIAFNQAAVIFNDGKMPVDVIFVEDNLNTGSIKHKVYDHTTKLKILTDWIQINFPVIEKPDVNVLGNLHDFYRVILNYPVDGGLNMVSIGDIFRWVGTTLMLIFIGPLIIMIFITSIRKYYERRSNI